MKNKLFDNIEKGQLESYLNNPDLAKEELDNAGYNVDSLVFEGLNLIKQHQFKLQVAQNKNHLQELLIKAKNLLIEKAKVSKDEALNIIALYQVKVQYRNISSFSEEELNEILKDVDLIKLIEHLEHKA
jgi:hypothetical protein